MLARWSLGLVIPLVLVFGRQETDYRLPKDVDSIRYELTLSPDLNLSIFDGKLGFIFKALKTTDVLVMNCKDLEFVNGSIKLVSKNGDEMRLASVEVNPSLERLYVKPQEPLMKGEFYKLEVEWVGKIYTDGIGLYSINYLGEGKKKKRMLASQFRPVHARRVFPCLDEPSFRAHVILKVIHNPDFKAVSNMPILHTKRTLPGTLTTEFVKTPPIPVFLVGLILSQLPEFEGENGFFAMATPENFEGIKYSAEIGPKMVAAMESLTGILYPLNKTHQVALPKLNPVAMENWGLYNFKENNILYFSGESPTMQKQTAARFSGHEICHSWMGNMVSLEWWDHLWMSEVFAMYYEYLLPDMVNHCWRMEEQMVIDLQQAGLLQDSLPVDPLTTKVLTPEEVSNKFSGVTYTKGPGVLRMAIHILGYQTFLQGFRKLLHTLAYNSLSSPDALWLYLSSEAKNLPADMATIMSNWTVFPGYPLVNVAVTKEGLLLSQSKFTLEEVAGSEQTWWIPLSYTTKTECDFVSAKPKNWFNPEHNMALIKTNLKQNDWVIFNIQSAGFYRVNYDLNNWNLIKRQLYEDSEKISPLNRAQLIDDSLNLARSSKLSYDMALSLIGYLANETDLIPWKSAIRGFSFLRTVLRESPHKKKFDLFLSRLVDKAFEKFGWDEDKSATHASKINKEQIVRFACQVDHKKCVDKSLEFSNSLMYGNWQSLSVDVKETAFCTGVEKGSSDFGEKVFSFYSDSSGAEAALYLKALTCLPSISAIDRILISRVGFADVSTWNSMFSSFASRMENAGKLLTLLNTHRSRITENIGVSQFVNHLKSLVPFLTTESQREILENLNVQYSGLEDALSALNKTISWRNTFLPRITSFLDREV
ncbi:aminopeptidase N-like isoform X2 [Cimex lectularius]|uniref:Aminopeptidase n=1 Tax=Cimex lectularius TaxID=79782 RepID=A0A8I6RHT5_CIMLE|nr:aminopeptidase N-like isoform X2 [Cimex lectularius]